MGAAGAVIGRITAIRTWAPEPPKAMDMTGRDAMRREVDQEVGGVYGSTKRWSECVMAVVSSGKAGEAAQGMMDGWGVRWGSATRRQRQILGRVAECSIVRQSIG